MSENALRLIASYVEEAAAARARFFADHAELVDAAARTMAVALARGGKILFCGNGGSAADSQHIAAEFTGRFIEDRKPLAALALSTDTSALTCIGNDYSFDEVFARQVAGLGRAGDVMIGISTSGNSPSILEAIAAAHDNEMRVVALTGKGGGQISKLLRDTDIHICVPSDRTARIQEVHLLTIHCLCDGVDCLLLGAEE